MTTSTSNDRKKIIIKCLDKIIAQAKIIEDEMQDAKSTKIGSVHSSRQILAPKTNQAVISTNVGLEAKYSGKGGQVYHIIIYQEPKQPNLPYKD